MTLKHSIFLKYYAFWTIRWSYSSSRQFLNDSTVIAKTHAYPLEYKLSAWIYFYIPSTNMLLSSTKDISFFISLILACVVFSYEFSSRTLILRYIEVAFLRRGTAKFADWMKSSSLSKMEGRGYSESSSSSLTKNLPTSGMIILIIRSPF